MIHVVRRGETLWGIARDYGVTERRLRSDNGIAAGQILVPGQALVILQPRERYVVQAGDTLSGIVRAAGTTHRRLLQLNPFLTRDGLQPGQELFLSLREPAAWRAELNGYAYPFVQPGVLRWVLPFLTELSVFSCGFREDGSLVPPEDAFLLGQAAEFGNRPVLVFTSVDESGTFSPERASRLFRNRDLQEKILDRLLALMEEKGYQGLDVDFEYIPPEDAAAFLTFLSRAGDRLHEQGNRLHVDLAPNTSVEQPGLLYEAHDYGAVGALADAVLLMTYEWGYAYGPPMAVAPLPQVERVLRYGLTEIPGSKIRMGIPNYGYDWILPYTRERRAVTVGNQEAVSLAARTGAEILYDEEARSPWFAYTAEGERHQVWFEDARSIREKLALAEKLGLSGAAWWSLLRPFPQNWAQVSATVQSDPGREGGE